MELSGQKIVLKEFTEKHLNNINYINWLRDLETISQINRLEYKLPMSHTSIKNYINNLLLSENDAFFAIHSIENDEFIGTQKIGHINWHNGTGDIGILIGNKNYRGKGLSKDSIYTACKYAFDVLSLRKLTANAFCTNLPMINCFKKLGFIEEGCLKESVLYEGNYIDQCLFGLFKPNLKTI